MNPAMFRKLTALGLDNEQIAGVLEIIEEREGEIAAADEGRKAKTRERVARWREKNRNVTVTATERNGDATERLAPAPVHTGSNYILPSEDNIKTSPKGEAKSPSADADPLPISEAFDAYNDMAGKAGLPKVKDRTPQRIKALRPILAEHGMDGWLQALETVTQTPFLLGANDRGWRADFDFLTATKKFAKIREGSYERTAVGPRLVHSNGQAPPGRPLRQNERIQQRLMNGGRHEQGFDEHTIDASYERRH